MSTLSINNLPSKFEPFLIGSPTCPVKEEEIDTIFQEPLTPLKGDYIFDAGKWVLKLGRTDGLSTTPDTHLYRVRKAEKIRAYIQKNHLEKHIAVPRKYLYWNTPENQFYVVAEKMNLSSEVATPASKDIENACKAVAPSFEGQLQALANNYPKRSLTPIQAKTLAELSFLGYTDLSYNNLYFTEDGKVALIDTEPRKRSLKKIFNSSFFARWLGDKGSLLTQQSIAGIAKLKLYTDDPTALKAVQRVEKNHVLWSIARLITKISAITLAIYFAPAVTALIPIAALATALKVSFIAAAVVKNLFLTINIHTVYTVWNYSYQGLQGVGKIVNMERQSLL